MEQELLELTKTYFKLMDEDISDEFLLLLVQAIIDSYKSKRNYPSFYTDDMIDADVEQYFGRRKSDVAMSLIPELYGRIGAEGLSMLTDAGTTRIYIKSVMLSDVTPICEVV